MAAAMFFAAAMAAPVSESVNRLSIVDPLREQVTRAAAGVPPASTALLLGYPQQLQQQQQQQQQQRQQQKPIPMTDDIVTAKVIRRPQVPITRFHFEPRTVTDDEVKLAAKKESMSVHEVAYRLGFLLQGRLQSGEFPEVPAKEIALAHYRCSTPCTLLLSSYLLRLIRCGPNPIGPDWVHNCTLMTAMAFLCRHNTLHGALSMNTAHRLLLASFVISIKLNHDQYVNNAVFATLGGVPKQELNLLELRFAQELDWELVVTERETNAWWEGVFSMGTNNWYTPSTPVENPIRVCAPQAVPQGGPQGGSQGGSQTGPQAAAATAPAATAPAATAPAATAPPAAPKHQQPKVLHLHRASNHEKKQAKPQVTAQETMLAIMAARANEKSAPKSERQGSGPSTNASVPPILCPIPNASSHVVHARRGIRVS